MYSTPPPGAQFSTERRSFAIVVNLSRWRDLNPRPLPYQGSALPLSYNSIERKTGLKPATPSLEG